MMKGIQVSKYVKAGHAASTEHPTPIPRRHANVPEQSVDELRVTDLPDPTPGPDDYLIEVHAAATNFFDILQVQGKYQNQPPFPWVAGAEFAGVVLATPARGTAHFPVGAPVFGAAQGAFATRVCAPEAALRPVPAGWALADAAGLFVTAPTSYAALVVRAGVKRGDWVLVHAAAGGVGLAAVQIAKALGATVVATASTAHKLAVARSFGADHVVNYRDADWADAVRRLTPRGRGVDVVFDPVGLVGRSTRCTAWNGRIVVVGFAGGGPIETVAMNKVLLKNISLVGLHWGQYMKHERETVRVVWSAIEKLIADGKLLPTVFTDKEFVGLESLPEALKALGSRESWGKVVVKLPQPSTSSSKL